MQQHHDIDSLGYNGLLEMASQKDCPDEVFNRLLGRYSVDDMWAKRIAEHPNAKDETKMRLLHKGYHLRAPAVAEALLATLPNTTQLVNELRVAYADHALDLGVVGVKAGTVDQQIYPRLHSAVGDLIKPDYRLGQTMPADGAKLTPTEANDLVSQFCTAYKDHPSVSAVPVFVASILQRSDTLSDQSIGNLMSIENNSPTPRNFLTSINDVKALLGQKALSDNVIGKALERSEGFIYKCQSTLKDSFINTSDHIKDVVRNIGVSLDEAKIKSKAGLRGVMEGDTHINARADAAPAVGFLRVISQATAARQQQADLEQKPKESRSNRFKM